MNLLPIEGKDSQHPLSDDIARWHKDKAFEFNQYIHTPVISNLERSLAITGALLIIADLPYRDVIARAHYFAQLAMAETQNNR